MTPARTKITKDAARYTDKAGPGQRCGTCAMFVNPGWCTLVMGAIRAEGWCVRWELKPSTAKEPGR